MSNEFDYSQREPENRKEFEDNFKAWLKKVKQKKDDADN